MKLFCPHQFATRLDRMVNGALLAKCLDCGKTIRVVWLSTLKKPGKRVWLFDQAGNQLGLFRQVRGRR